MSATADETHGYRDGTAVREIALNFVFNDEGMGGFLNYAGVTTWLAQNCPHIKGTVWVEQFLVPLLKDIHAPYKHWQVQPQNQYQRLRVPGTPTIGPLIASGNNEPKRELLTAIGTHPFDVGFGYFASTCPAPADARLPILDYPAQLLRPNIKRLHGKYVVFTAGGTTPIRTMRGRDLNPLIAHVKSLGLTPVFLGKRDMLTDGKVNTTYADDTQYSEGIDLRDQTSVKDAALIMQHAACTVGIDGGLLHLAALMHNSRIVFGYNITSVAHREPRRDHGRTVNVALSRKELACTACQSTWKIMLGHFYDECYYVRQGVDKTPKCLDLLFANDSIKFKNAIDEVLK